MWWNLLYVPVFALTLAIGYAGYDRMPKRIPLQVNLDGQVMRSMAKSPMAIWLPVLVFGLLSRVLVYSQYVIAHSKKGIDPNDPRRSALAYGLYARAWSVFTLITGLIVCMLAPVMELTLTGVIALRQAMIIVLNALIIVIGGSATLSVMLGQNGSRIPLGTHDGAGMPYDDDAHWKLGVFYIDHDDASVFVPRRFGVGWTVNLGRPATWIMLAILTALTVGALVAVMMLA